VMPFFGGGGELMSKHLRLETEERDVIGACVNRFSVCGTHLPNKKTVSISGSRSLLTLPPLNTENKHDL
jgi:hypothetical protein